MRLIQRARSTASAFGLVLALSAAAPTSEAAAQAPAEPAELRLGSPRYEGTPTGGRRVKLIAGGSRVGTTVYRWKQVDGPTVELSRTVGEEVEFTVPDVRGTLRFLLVGANSLGADASELVVPIEPATHDRETTRTSSRAAELSADAGDDQIAIVGRQVTLNGNRSEPRGRIGFRWVQVGGPAVRLAIEERNFYSFIPPLPGEYRFALLVASGDEISKPDVVTVTVGGSRPSAGPAVSSASVPSAAAEPPVSIRETARAGLAAVNGAERAEKLARTFEDAADRMGLYRTYAEAYHEVSRRLDVILPRDENQRRAWIDGVFNPLTERLVEAARTEGLELRTVEGQAAPLTDAQRDKLSEQFRLMGEGFRAVAPAVPTPAPTAAPVSR